MKPKNPVENWNITLGQNSFLRHARAQTWQFRGTFEEALSEADQLECEVEFLVSRVVIERDGPNPPKHDDVAELRAALMQCREALSHRMNREHVEAAITRADAALFLAGDDERRALGCTDWANDKTTEPVRTQ